MDQSFLIALSNAKSDALKLYFLMYSHASVAP